MESTTGYDAKTLSRVLGVTPRRVRMRAAAESWPVVPANGDGRGGRRYRLAGLPEDVQAALAAAGATGLDSGVRRNDEDLTDRQVRAALARADLVRAYLAALRKTRGHGGRGRAGERFIQAYNSGLAWPQLYEVLGPISRRTIERWKQGLQETGDPLSLADRRGAHRRGARTLSPEQTDILLRCVLHPNKPLISEAMRMARAVMAETGVRDGHSDATYRRWLDDWRSHNVHVWTFLREGKKAWNDQVASYIERDLGALNVGDVLVADGHTLNCEILNPWTGKPKRMTLILWYDMASSFPVGWEIMPTENTQAIASALRRAILRLGKIPRVVYLDNGKAFGARFFKGADLTQAGVLGLFERLGIQTITAWPYHGQSKTVERFFRTFGELERWLPTYTGTSVDTKPPRLNRGERLHRAVHDKLMAGRAMTLGAAHRAVAAWFDLYSARPQRGHLQGRTPAEVFDAGRGPGVDPAELRYLMMAIEIRTLGRNGVRLLGRNYYAPELYGRRHPVLVRYDLQDASAVLVEDLDGSIICEARAVEPVHPAASILGTDEDRERLARQIEHKRAQEKAASASARAFLESEILPETQRLLETIPRPAGEIPEAKPKEIDRKQIERDLAERERWQAEARAAEAEAEEPEPVVVEPEPAKSFWDELQELPEMDRYERLLECEARGQLIPRGYQSFMRYFEQTELYAGLRDYFETRRSQFAVVYQSRDNDALYC